MKKVGCLKSKTVVSKRKIIETNCALHNLCQIQTEQIYINMIYNKLPNLIGSDKKDINATRLQQYKRYMQA